MFVFLCETETVMQYRNCKNGSQILKNPLLVGSPYGSIHVIGSLVEKNIMRRTRRIIFVAIGSLTL